MYEVCVVSWRSENTFHTHTASGQVCTCLSLVYALISAGCVSCCFLLLSATHDTVWQPQTSLHKHGVICGKEYPLVHNKGLFSPSSSQHFAHLVVSISNLLLPPLLVKVIGISCVYFQQHSTVSFSVLLITCMVISGFCCLTMCHLLACSTQLSVWIIIHKSAN